MKQKLISIALLVAVVTAFAIAPVTSVRAAPAVNLDVTGTFNDALGGVGTFVGNLALSRFAVQNGALVAIGTLTGTLTDSAGNLVGTVTRTVTLPVAAQGTCDILHLTLGPLDLDLLGLMVHLDQVVLDITAQQGPGNLLGNLLCAVAGLLDNTGNLTGIASLLNRILNILG